MNDASPSPSPPAAPPPLPPGAGFWADFDKALSPPRPPPLAEPKAAAEPLRRRTVGPGQRLGPWELLGTLGRGGMGEVFVAFYGPGHRRFALKILDGDARDDPEARKRFEYEFWSLDRLHRELHHESIVAPFCAGEDDGLLWYAMELLKGESLDHVANREILAPLRVCRIGVQIADACAGMHGIGLIHRDLKPGNIFLLEGEGDRIKLLDTGIAKLLPEFFADAEMRPRVEERVQTLVGVPIGTAGFMAPEVILGAKAAAPAQDIFGLAATLFRLAVGRHAYQSLLCPGPGDEPRWSKDLGRPLPMALEVVLRKALAVDPSCRQASMSELREQLALVVEELEAEAEEDAEAAEAEAKEGGRPAGEPARGDAAATVIEVAAASEAVERGGDVGEAAGDGAPGAEAIAMEPAARSSAAEDLPAPSIGEVAAAELERPDRGSGGPPGDDGRAVDPAGERRSAAELAASERRRRRASITAVAVLCVALGFGLGRVPAGGDAGITRWARGVAATARHLPVREIEAAVPAPPVPPPRREDPVSDDAIPEVAPPPAEDATPEAPTDSPPNRLGRAAFRKVVRAHTTALDPCIRMLPEGTEAAAEVRVSPDGSVERVRLVPEVSFIAQRCVDKALGGLRFPQADAPSNHTWPLARP